MTNRKTAYIDFSKPEYKNFSDEEIQTLKKVNSMGNRKNLKSCKIHGIHEPILHKSYDGNYNEINYFGCHECFKNSIKNDKNEN